MVRAVILLITVLALRAAPLTAGAIDDCETADGSERQFAACTQMIECDCLGDAERARAYILRGLGLARQGRDRRAIEDLNAAITLHPENMNAWFVRAGAYFRLGEYRKALSDYDVLYESGAFRLKVLMDRGPAYISLGNYERAVRDLDEALLLDPGNALAHNNRAIAHAALGEMELAISDFSAAIRLDPGFVYAYQSRAEAYLEHGDFAAALRDAKTRLMLAPDDPESHENLGYVLCRIGRPEDAATAQAEARRLRPLSPEEVGTRLAALSRQGFVQGPAEATHEVTFEAAERAWIEAGCPSPEP